MGDHWGRGLDLDLDQGLTIFSGLSQIGMFLQLNINRPFHNLYFQKFINSTAFQISDLSAYKGKGTLLLLFFSYLKLNQDDYVGDTEKNVFFVHEIYGQKFKMHNLTDIILVIVVFVISKYPSPVIGFNISTLFSK